MEKTDSKKITKRILRWYRENGRSLPWRQTRDPYAIWVSEVMLQQTRVETVVPFFNRFLSRFPTVKDLAESSLQDVLKTWENMGYYSRARNLHKSARLVSDEMEGRIPETYEGLIRLPGIGAYTASAILAFAFGKKILAMDANVSRVFTRFFCIVKYLDDPETASKLRELAAPYLSTTNDSSSFNQALMDLGATICTPRSPECGACPVRENCVACRLNMQGRLPLRRRREPIPHREMTAGLIRDRKGRFLVIQRPAHGLLGGLWKFPGGEKGRRETLPEALSRTIREEVGIQVQVGLKIGVVKHAFTHFRMSLHVFHCRKVRGAPHALGCAGWQWAGSRGLLSLPFPKADRRIIELLMTEEDGRRK